MLRGRCFQSRVAARLTIIPQRLQGWRSCVHIVPDVSCDFRPPRTCSWPVLRVVNEPVANHLGARDAVLFSGSRTKRILRAQRAELSFSALCHRSIVKKQLVFLAVHKRPIHQLVYTRGCVRSPKRFQAVQLLRHFWRHNVFVCLVFRQVYQPSSSAFHGARRRRHPGLPALISRGPLSSLPA